MPRCKCPTSGTVAHATRRCVFAALLHWATPSGTWRLGGGEGLTLPSDTLDRHPELLCAAAWDLQSFPMCTVRRFYLIGMINVSIRATDRLSRESKIADCQTVSRDCLLKHPILQNSIGSAAVYKPCQPSATRLAHLTQASSSSILYNGTFVLPGTVKQCGYFISCVKPQFI